MTVRVIRILEYSYPTHAECEADMARWFVPPSGIKRGIGLKGQTVIRSAVTLTELLPEEDPRPDFGTISVKGM
jgi:hypothetical protein